jgi:hypothetical protein
MKKPVSNSSVNNDWHGVLKNMVMDYIQKSIDQIIAEIPVEKIIQEAVINAVRGGTPQNNGTLGAKKPKVKKPEVKKPLPIVETPKVETPLEEMPIVEKERFYTGGSFVDDDRKLYTYARSKEGKIEKVELPLEKTMEGETPEIETSPKTVESSGEKEP